MSLFQTFARINNAVTVPLLKLPGINRLAARSVTTLTYTGRRSGREIELPVAYKRTGEKVVVGVAMADRKTWWRNFTGDGGAISLPLDGQPRTGHARAGRDTKGRVYVGIDLDPV